MPALYLSILLGIVRVRLKGNLHIYDLCRAICNNWVDKLYNATAGPMEQEGLLESLMIRAERCSAFRPDCVVL